MVIEPGAAPAATRPVRALPQTPRLAVVLDRIRDDVRSPGTRTSTGRAAACLAALAAPSRPKYAVVAK